MVTSADAHILGPSVIPKTLVPNQQPSLKQKAWSGSSLRAARKTQEPAERDSLLVCARSAQQAAVVGRWRRLLACLPMLLLTSAGSLTFEHARRRFAHKQAASLFVAAVQLRAVTNSSPIQHATSTAMKITELLSVPAANADNSAHWRSEQHDDVGMRGATDQQQSVVNSHPQQQRRMDMASLDLFAQQYVVRETSKQARTLADFLEGLCAILTRLLFLHT